MVTMGMTRPGGLLLSVVMAGTLSAAGAGPAVPVGGGHWRLRADPDGRRDSRTTFTAYVPPGSLARDKLLAGTGAGVTALACVTCHGAQLQGLGQASI
jgi:hypothetical protein